jgi:formamidopyrimidine-DNA glycosylase
VPELPEAETIVRALRPVIEGARIRRAEVVRPDVLRSSPARLSACVRDRRILAVDRRAKNILLRLEGHRVVVVNLGMTGKLLTFDRPPRGLRRPTHPAVHFRLVGGALLTFDDTRRFGTVECLSDAEWSERSARFGPEPLERTYHARDLHAALATSRAPLRSWLLDQTRIAGIGNIYASEALYLAGLHPRRRARGVTRAEAARLHRAIRRVLRAAIRAGGTTIRDYRNADGTEGAFARKLFVYGRNGTACPRCRTEIRRIVFGGRSAFYCPRCQPMTSRP